MTCAADIRFTIKTSTHIVPYLTAIPAVHELWLRVQSCVVLWKTFVSTMLRERAVGLLPAMPPSYSHLPTPATTGERVTRRDSPRLLAHFSQSRVNSGSRFRTFGRELHQRQKRKQNACRCGNPCGCLVAQSDNGRPPMFATHVSGSYKHTQYLRVMLTFNGRRVIQRDFRKTLPISKVTIKLRRRSKRLHLGNPSNFRLLHGLMTASESAQSVMNQNRSRNSRCC